MYNQFSKARLIFVSFFFIVFLSILLLRLFYILWFESSTFKTIAERQQTETVKLEPKRGTIYDRNLRALALALNVDSIYAISKKIENKSEVAEILAPILGISNKFILKRLEKDKSFVWLARKIPESQSSNVRDLKISGIEFVKESKRFYSRDAFASHIIGFTDLDNQGIEGLELFYNKYLQGTPGWRSVIRDAKGRDVISLGQKTFPPKDGYDLVLTVDEVIQHIVETEIDRVVYEHRAKSGVIIVMDPKNGDILALGCRPTFNLNSVGNSNPNFRRNRAICDFFEPGSSFKIVTAAAVLEENLVKPEDKFYCEKGTYKIFGHTLHDHKPHEWLTFREIIVYSSNIGTMKVAQTLGAKNLYRYIKLFGFGSKIGIDLPGETSGMVRPPQKWSKLSMTAIPMGQEIGVTPIQLACAISTIANGGLLVKPKIVKYIQDKNGEVIKSFANVQVVHRVISEDAAEKLKKILVEVVEEGTGKSAQIAEYKVAGKTGTAQKVSEGGSYSHSKFIASFIGFAPAENPKISIVVIVDEPSPSFYGGVVAAPVFQRVASQVLRYLEIPPTLQKTASLGE